MSAQRPAVLEYIRESLMDVRFGPTGYAGGINYGQPMGAIGAAQRAQVITFSEASLLRDMAAIGANYADASEAAASSEGDSHHA